MRRRRIRDLVVFACVTFPRNEGKTYLLCQLVRARRLRRKDDLDTDL